MKNMWCFAELERLKRKKKLIFFPCCLFVPLFLKKNKKTFSLKHLKKKKRHQYLNKLPLNMKFFYFKFLFINSYTFVSKQRTVLFEGKSCCPVHLIKQVLCVCVCMMGEGEGRDELCIFEEKNTICTLT